MRVAGIVVGAAEGAATRKNVLAKALSGALAAGLEEVVAVLSHQAQLAEVPVAVSVLLDESGLGTNRLLRSGLDYAARHGFDAAVVAPLEEASDAASLSDAQAWRALAQAERSRLLGATRRNRRIGLYRLDASTWALVPFEGPFSAFLDVQASLLTSEELPLATDAPA